MDIAQTNSDTNTAASDIDTQTVYININPTLLAININNGTLTHQFNGKGNTVTTIPANDQSTYLYYSSDKAGDNAITPPFSIPKGNYISFNLQTKSSSDNSDSNAAVYKWKGITQNQFDLKVTSKKDRYKGMKTTTASGADQVTIKMKLTLKNTNYYVAWDPQIIVIS
jgi:hypothetical protein